jgi:hypothetical protein
MELDGGEKVTECFWCNEVFNSADHGSCPNCARDTHTKEINVDKKVSEATLD